MADPGILSCMGDKTYLVRLKRPDMAIQQVVAVGAQIQGEHLVFVNSSGKLAGLFLLDLVESWDRDLS
jgi:hypothetical protein